MKKLGIVLASSVLLAACGQESAELNTDDQKASYALGFRSAEQMSSLENLDMEAMIAGLRDGYKGDGAASELADADLDQLIQDFQMRMIEGEQKKMAAAASSNLEEAEAFLAENAQRDGVTVTDSGLQYKVLASGEGASPSLDDTVKVHYHGTLPDGTVFDSSVERGNPASFGLQHIIQGWQEALPMMSEGDKWELALPPALGYGEQGTGGDIGPNQVLIFEVELLEVKSANSQED